MSFLCKKPSKSFWCRIKFIISSTLIKCCLQTNHTKGFGQMYWFFFFFAWFGVKWNFFVLFCFKLIVPNVYLKTLQSFNRNWVCWSLPWQYKCFQINILRKSKTKKIITKCSLTAATGYSAQEKHKNKHKTILLLIAICPY